MPNIYVNNIPVPKVARNKRQYASGAVSQTVGTSQAATQTGKTILTGYTNEPKIADYTIYSSLYGQYPTVALFIVTNYATGERIKRTELPYYAMTQDSEGKQIIASITFGILPEGALAWVIELGL